MLQVALPPLILAIPALLIYRNPELIAKYIGREPQKVAVPLPPAVETHASPPALSRLNTQPAVTLAPPSVPATPTRPLWGGKNLDPPQPFVEKTEGIDSSTAAHPPQQNEANRPAQERFDVDSFIGAKPKSPSSESDSPGELVSLAISLQTSKWLVPVPNVNPNGKFYVDSIKNGPSTIQLFPTSGELSFDQVTRITLDEAIGMVLELQLEKSDDPESLFVSGEWSCEAVGGTREQFSLSRLESRQLYLNKQANQLSRNLNTLSIERNKLQAFLTGPGPKPLTAFKQAKNRLAVVESSMQVANIQWQQTAQKMTWFTTFEKNVERLHDEGALLIRCDTKPADPIASQ
ncbi:hypothetical protein [Novipirellula artificiosorum]|uniref:hypothetical protein n=1 Tax=Novipirellula artificiosorum TaxID=2528016 RepID=UPI0011B84373|nr:hypothetical protein [Novipirellula artificiosorum]